MHQVLRLKNMLAKSWPQAALALIKARAHELEVSFLIRSIPTADSMVAANHQWQDVAISFTWALFEVFGSLAQTKRLFMVDFWTWLKILDFYLVKGL